MHPPPSLRDLMRQRTAAAHLALEATPLMHAIAEGRASDPAYRSYLAAQWALHAPLEAALRPWVSPAWRRLRLVKANWLANDLAAVGATAPFAEIDAVEITSEAQALGTMYVLEGSTLGLQMVRRKLMARGAGWAQASCFMRGYGDKTGANWREFVDRLNGLPAATWPQAIDAACATFSTFLRRFATPALQASR